MSVHPKKTAPRRTARCDEPPPDALLHGIEMLRDAFEWPAIVSRLTVIALLAGIPIAVTLAWFHGHRAQHRVTRSELSILILLLIVGGTVL